MEEKIPQQLFCGDKHHLRIESHYSLHAYVDSIGNNMH